jgi:hypothetical protein
VGDAQTTGHAWSVVSASLLARGSARAAVSAAQRARTYAGGTPAAVMAILGRACAEAELGRADAVLDAVAEAEREHARLPAELWGEPGYSLGTYHPAQLKAFAGLSLVKAGMHAAAAPRLAEAADLLAGTGSGLLVVVWLSQATSALAAGDVDGAYDLVAMAVTQAEHRPSAWVAEAVIRHNELARGAMSDLVERVRRWGF